jgi:pilus assembly protein Flp/PilA
MGSIQQFINEEQGADLIEYALLAGLISLACVVTLTTIGTKVGSIFEKIAAKLTATTTDIAP